MVAQQIAHPSLDERRMAGGQARKRTGPSSHAGWRPAAIAEYLGSSDTFNQAITDFCERHADQNEQDHQQFVAAVRSGRLDALEGRLMTGVTDAG